MSPRDPLDNVETKDPKLDALLKELATRDNWALLEQVFLQMRDFSVETLIDCKTEEERLGAQAFAVVTNSLRQRLTRYRRDLTTAKPIMVK